MQYESKIISVAASQRKPFGNPEPITLATGSPPFPGFFFPLKTSVYGSQKKLAPRHGFSLVELMVVMIIIGLLSSLVAVQTRSYLIASKQHAAQAEISTMVSALESFYADQSRYPTNDEGIEILTRGTRSFPDGFLKKLPLDPWGNPYEYVSPGTKSPFEIVCLGADGREGGELGDADISSEALDEKTK
jgi:general secretion pathway protein G